MTSYIAGVVAVVDGVLSAIRTLQRNTALFATISERLAVLQMILNRTPSPDLPPL